MGSAKKGLIPWEHEQIQEFGVTSVWVKCAFAFATQSFVSAPWADDLVIVDEFVSNIVSCSGISTRLG